MLFAFTFLPKAAHVKELAKMNSPRESHVKVAALILSLVGASLALLAVLAQPSTQTVAKYWRVESIVLICTLNALSLITFLLSKRLVPALALMTVRALLVWVVGEPYGGWVLLKLPLWSSLFIEAGGFLGPPTSLLVQSSFLVFILVSQRPLLIWGDELVPGLASLQIVAVAVFLVGLAVLLFLLKSAVTAVGRQTAVSARLDEAVSRLSAANLGFQKLASAAEERSAEDERKRITREIHDAIGYALTNLIMMAEAAIRMSPRDALGLRDLLAQAREEAQVGLNETRKALRLLRNVPAERVQGLPAIHRLVGLFGSATGVEVKVEYCNAFQSYGEEADMVVYRMIQEGMTNAFRHGRATVIRLQFWQDAGGLRVTLWDNGRGVDQTVKEGIGLSGMRERLERIGGNVQAERVPDGFALRAWIPLPIRSGSTSPINERKETRGKDFAASC